MKKLFLLVIISIIFHSICLGQSEEISRNDFEKLKFHLPYDYLGNTFFKRISLPGGYPIIIKADWNNISFNKSDSSLEITGSVYDNSKNKNYMIYSGKLFVDSLKQEANILNPVKKPIYIKEIFKFETKIKSIEDILCIVIPVEETDNEILIVMQFPLFYKIGELIK